MPYALIVDDDVDFIPALSQIVQQQGYHVRIAKSLEEARQELQRGIPDVALIDLLLPDGDGIQLVRDLTLTGSTKVLIITGYAGVESAVAALRAGVTDFMQKPIDVGQLRRQLQLIKDEFDNRLPVETGQLFDENGLGDIVGRSPQMHTVYNLVKKVAPTVLTDFIYGESGTGKELVAHAVHAKSTRRDKPFVALNCAAVPPQLIATEFSVMKKAPSPTPTLSTRVVSSAPRAGHCFSMKSRKCLSSSKCNFCAHWSRVASRAWVAVRKFRSTSVSSPPPIARLSRRWRTESSAKISCSVS